MALYFLDVILLQKWSKGKQQDKLNNNVIMDAVTRDKLFNEIPKSRLITPSTVSERLRINVSLARQALKELEAKNLIQSVGTRHHAQQLYTRCVTTADE